jgi:hypothetical protein
MESFRHLLEAEGAEEEVLHGRSGPAVERGDSRA